MKIKVVIETEDGKVLFQGNPLNLPIREEDIKRVSIEMFRDENPCIIHQSYAIQKLIEGMLQHFGRKTMVKEPLANHLSHVSFLKLDALESLLMSMEVKG